MIRTWLHGRTILCRLEERGLWLSFASLVRELVTSACDVHVSIPPDVAGYVSVVAFEGLGVRSVRVETDLVPESLSGGVECFVHYGGSNPVSVLACPVVYVPARGACDDVFAGIPLRSGASAGQAQTVHVPTDGVDGWVGPGMASLTLAIASVLQPQSLHGRHFLITAGPTVEDIDPVRFISNRSSGKMGLALALVAGVRGARVTLVHGPMSVTVPVFAGLDAIPVRSASQMHDCVLSRAVACDAVIMCAAVADFTPATVAHQKIKKKSRDAVNMLLVRTPDILADVGRLPDCDRPVVVGFAAETRDVAINAMAKLERKNCDLLCANDVSETGSGFGTDTNRVTIYSREGVPVALPLLTKEEAAGRILDKVTALL